MNTENTSAKSATELIAVMEPRINQTLECYQKTRAKVVDELRTVDLRLSDVGLVSRILRQIQVDWKEPNPGKYGAAFFFVNARRVRDIPRDLLGGKEPNKRANVCSWEEVARVGCPVCKLSTPLVQEYHQIRATPEGDTWQKRFFAVCQRCFLASPVGEPIHSSNRF